MNVYRIQSAVRVKLFPGLPVRVTDTPNCPNAERLASSPTAPCLILCGFFFFSFALTTASCSRAPRHTRRPLTSVFAPSAAPWKRSLPQLFSLQTLTRPGRFSSPHLPAPPCTPAAHPPPRHSLWAAHWIAADLFTWSDRQLQREGEDSSVGRKFSAAGILEQAFNK